MNEICWIGESGIAIVMRPRGDDWLRNELLRMKHGGIQTLVSTLETTEASELGLTSERFLAEETGFHFLSYPIKDRATPERKNDFDEFISGLAERSRAGEKIGVHCRGCIGRSTLVTACTLIKLGWPAKHALRSIEIARGCTVPDTSEQRNWILDFGAVR